jgi:hypothetical protein
MPAIPLINDLNILFTHEYIREREIERERERFAQQEPLMYLTPRTEQNATLDCIKTS